MENIEVIHIDADPSRPFVIILCSDNHGDRASLEYIRSKHPDADLFVHLGDSEMSEDEMKDFICVKGNHDYYPNGTIPDHKIIETAGHRIYLCHGHMDMLIYYHFDVMARYAKKQNCDIVFFGHMHICQDISEEGVRLLNPGSLAYSRNRSGKSYMIVSLTPDTIDAQRVDYSPGNEKPRRKSFLERWIEKL